VPTQAGERAAGRSRLDPRDQANGFRILARRDGNGVRLYTRNGYNFADRFQRIVEAVASLPVQSCFIDGEAIVVDERGYRPLSCYAPGRTTMPLCCAPST
jgi:hypothetical protein